MDMQKIVTLDGFGVRVDPRDCFVKYATLFRCDRIDALTVKVLQAFEVVWGPHGPHISILGLITPIPSTHRM